MWQVLIRKSRTDFTSRPFQFLLTGLLLAFSAAGITLGLTVREAANAPWERAFERANGPHIWMGSADPEALEVAFLVPDVAEAGPEMRSLSGLYAISARDKPTVVTVESPAGGEQFIGKPYMTRGRWVDTGSAVPEVVIGSGTARAFDLEVGDSLTIGGEDRQVELAVVGIGVLTFRAPYPAWDPVFVFVNTSGFEGLAGPDAEVIYRGGVRLHDPQSAGLVQARIARLTRDGEQLKIGSISWTSVLEGVNEDIVFYQITFFLFGTMAALASMMIVANVIAGQVIAQAREIGTLKAVGLTPAGVLRVFLLENLAVAAVAGAIGIAIGVGLGQLIVGRDASLFGGAYIGIHWGALGMALLITLAIAAVATLVPAFRASRLPVASVTNGRATSGAGRRRRRGPLELLLRRSPEYAAGARLVWTSEARALLTIATIVVAVISSMLLLGFNKLFDPDVQVRLGAPPGDVIVAQVGDVRPDGLRPALDDPRVESSYTYTPFTGHFVTDAHELYLNARAFNEGFDGARWTYVAGGPPGQPGEVVIGWRLADETGVRVGDTVKFGVADNLGEATISGVISSGENGGRVVWIKSDDLEATTGEDITITEAVLTLRPRVSEASFMTDLSDRTDVAYNVVSVQGEIDEAIGQFALPVYTLSAMMLAVAALSVLTSTLLTVRERFRDIASLKAAGMTPSQVVAGVVAAVSGLSLAGLAIGLPLGFLVNRQVMSFVGSESDAGPGLVADPGALWLLALCAAILALGAVSALLPARAGARISVSAALRYE